MNFAFNLRGVWFVVAILTAFSSYAETNNDETDGIEEIIVTAHPLGGEGLSQPSDVLYGDALAEELDASIGGTLSNLPGVQSASFGYAVGRPVIHGLAGPRVRVMQDRIDTMDISVTSADHAVTVDPFTADSVEVLKGPAALLYGSGAIGGVVNVQTGRIPRAVPEELGVRVEHRYNDNFDGNATSARIDGGAGNFAFHFDGSWRDGDEYEIPGFAESAAQRALEEEEEHDEEEEEEEGEHGHEEEEEAFGELPGSQFDFDSMAGGVSYVADWGFAGIAVSRITAEYGLPGGHGHEEGHDEEEGEDEEEHEEEEEEGNPILDMEQDRIDVEIGINEPWAGFESLNIRLGRNDYEHVEFEPNGEAGTVFENEAWELRTEAVMASENSRTAFGLQHFRREFSAVGEEAFVPPVDTVSTGAFWVREQDFDAGSLEMGLRLEQTNHDPDAGSERDFTGYSASLGVVLPLSDTLTLNVFGDISSRAPVAEELFSNGPHLATNAFEIGDPDLDEESAAHVSAGLSYGGERVRVDVTGYATSFSDFIFETPTGEEEDELPVFQFMQRDATFSGLDLSASVRAAEFDNGALFFSGHYEFVNAELDTRGNDNIPRIPPHRWGLGAELLLGKLTAKLNFRRYAEQDDVTDAELPTDSYEDLRAYVGFKFDAGPTEATIFLQGRNLTDDEQRHHSSFIKDFAPAPGRTIEAGVRVSL